MNTLLQSDIVIFRFKPEVVQLFDGRGANNIFMDGKDLTFILKGRLVLRDALRRKIERASKDSKVYCHLHEIGC